MMRLDKAEQLMALVRRYRSRGLIWGKELLLPPKDALDLVDELEELGVAIWGIDTYYQRDPNNKLALAENVGRDLSVPDEIMAASDSVQRSASMARDFITSGLPERTSHVSIFLEDAYHNIDFFPEEPTPNAPH